MPLNNTLFIFPPQPSRNTKNCPFQRHVTQRNISEDSNIKRFKSAKTERALRDQLNILCFLNKNRYLSSSHSQI